MEGNDNSAILAALFPHPPIAVPGVGRGREKDCEKTIHAMARLASFIVDADPDAIVLLSPHSPRQSQAFGIWSVGRLKGSLVLFGRPEACVDLPNNVNLNQALREAAVEEGILTWDIEGNFTEDHGAIVPLWYIYQANWRGPTTVISMNYPDAGGLEELGRAISTAAKKLGQRVAVVASGDMSHRLKPGAPAGFDKRASEFDKKFVELLKKHDYHGISKMDYHLREIAAEDVVDTTLTAMAATGYDTSGARLLSYEGPFGVGYTVAMLCDHHNQEDEPEDMQVEDESEMSEHQLKQQLLDYVRRVVESIARREGEPEAPQAVGYLSKKAGAFVTLHTTSGELRGCVGTIGPTRDNIVKEVRNSAEMAAFDDTRFMPVSADELDGLVYEISILHEPEPVGSIDELDPEIYGVIIQSDRGRRALMLPGIESLDTVEKQLAATRMKAGISPSEDIIIQRFKVDKIK